MVTGPSKTVPHDNFFFGVTVRVHSSVILASHVYVLHIRLEMTRWTFAGLLVMTVSNRSIVAMTREFGPSVRLQFEGFPL